MILGKPSATEDISANHLCKGNDAILIIFALYEDFDFKICI